jgi:hypothetical protein
MYVPGVVDPMEISVTEFAIFILSPLKIIYTKIYKRCPPIFSPTAFYSMFIKINGVGQSLSTGLNAL